MSNIVKTGFRSIIKFFLINILLFFSSPQLLFAKNESCGFKPEYSIYLFSGTISATLYRLGLYDDPQIKGLMEMYQFKPSNKKVFSGGIYLSQKLAETIEEKAVIFHEESADLEITLKQVNSRLKKKWIIHKLYTKRKSPKDLSLEALNNISAYLIDNEKCKKIVDQQRARINLLEKTIENRKVISVNAPKVYFFMGKWQGDTPEAKALVIYQEGFVAELLKQKMIAAYDENELKMNYTPWSAKKFFNEKAIYVGVVSELNDKGQSGELQKIKELKYQSYCFACLIPGIFQLEWMSRIKF